MAIDLSFLRQRLLECLVEIEEQDRISAEGRNPVRLEQDSVGRLSRMDAMQMQAMALAQERRRKVERNAIVAALQRIENDDFGYCITCGDPIAELRLRNEPTALKCVDCASATL